MAEDEQDDSQLAHRHLVVGIIKLVTKHLESEQEYKGNNCINEQKGNNCVD